MRTSDNIPYVRVSYDLNPDMNLFRPVLIGILLPLQVSFCLLSFAEEISPPAKTAAVSDEKKQPFTEGFRFIWKQFRVYCQKMGELPYTEENRRILASHLYESIRQAFPGEVKKNPIPSTWSFVIGDGEPFEDQGIGCDVIMHLNFRDVKNHSENPTSDFVDAVKKYKDAIAVYKSSKSQSSLSILKDARQILIDKLEESKIKDADRIFGGSEIQKLFCN